MLKSGPVTALGAMSGTSLDGVDAAVVVTDGVTISSFGPTAYRGYTGAERDVLRGVLGCWHDDDVAQAAEVIETVHAQVLSGFEDVDVVGFHGQTLAHDPQGRGTHQAGSGDVLAAVLDVPVVWDFRSADVQLGGQGAPLAPFFHFACGRFIGASEPIAFLNLGGVGNVTYVDPSYDQPEEDGALLAFDTGPANAPLNDLMRARCGVEIDKGGSMALSGTADQLIVDAFLSDRYFAKMPPKSLDRDSFSQLSEAVADLSDVDAAATLTACVAQSVSQGCSYFPTPVAQILVCGGGRHNAALMQALAQAVPARVVPVEEVGLDGDMLEAQAFAHLAVRVMRGLPTSGPSTTGVRGAVAGGTLSQPS